MPSKRTQNKYASLKLQSLNRYLCVYKRVLSHETQSYCEYKLFAHKQPLITITRKTESSKKKRRQTTCPSLIAIPMKWHRSLTVQSHDSRMVTMIHVLVNTYLKFSSQWAGYGTAQLTGALWISIYCAWTRSNWPICEYINEEQIIICQFD